MGIRRERDGDGHKIRPNGGCGDLRRVDEGNKEGEVPALWDLSLLIKALEVNELLISGSIMCREQLELRDGACHFITAMHYTLKLLCLERSHSIMVRLHLHSC